MREERLWQQILRGQIDSHFLYNSMHELHKLIDKGNIDNVTKFLRPFILITMHLVGTGMEVAKILKPGKFIG